MDRKAKQRQEAPQALQETTFGSSNSGLQVGYNTGTIHTVFNYHQSQSLFGSLQEETGRMQDSTREFLATRAQAQAGRQVSQDLALVMYYFQ
jgi:hypothetical protein